MASVVHICNLALAHLGQNPNVSSIDPPEGSIHAEKCAMFYPIARDMLLELNDWTFAIQRQALAALSGAEIPGWEYAYATPSNCLKPLKILTEDQDESLDDLAPIDFIYEGATLYTNQEDAVLKFVAKVTDTTKWSPLFVNALSWLLASYLAGPVTKDPKIKDATYKNFWIEMSKATNVNTNIGRQAEYPKHNPSWMKNR